jgi:RES domain-containing protein
MASAELTLEKLRNAMKRLRAAASSLDGHAFRSTSPKYATEADIVSGKGAAMVGGRWNPLGVAAVYASLTPETAMAETLSHHRYYRIPVENAMPRTFVALEIMLQAVLDLRIGPVRQRLRFSESRIVDVDWRKEMRQGNVPPTHLIGLAASLEAYEGLIVPSASDPGGSNLVVFPANLGRDSLIRIFHPDGHKS